MTTPINHKRDWTAEDTAKLLYMHHYAQTLHDKSLVHKNHARVIAHTLGRTLGASRMRKSLFRSKKLEEISTIEKLYQILTEDVYIDFELSFEINIDAIARYDFRSRTLAPAHNNGRPAYTSPQQSTKEQEEENYSYMVKRIVRRKYRTATPRGEIFATKREAEAKAVEWLKENKYWIEVYKVTKINIEFKTIAKITE